MTALRFLGFVATADQVIATWDDGSWAVYDPSDRPKGQGVWRAMPKPDHVFLFPSPGPRDAVTNRIVMALGSITDAVEFLDAAIARSTETPNREGQ